VVATVSEFLTVGFSHPRIHNPKSLILAGSSRFDKNEPAVRKALNAATSLSGSRATLCIGVHLAISEGIYQAAGGGQLDVVGGWAIDASESELP